MGGVWVSGTTLADWERCVVSSMIVYNNYYVSHQAQWVSMETTALGRENQSSSKWG